MFWPEGTYCHMSFKDLFFYTSIFFVQDMAVLIDNTISLLEMSTTTKWFNLPDITPNTMDRCFNNNMIFFKNLSSALFIKYKKIKVKHFAHKTSYENFMDLNKKKNISIFIRLSMIFFLRIAVAQLTHKKKLPNAPTNKQKGIGCKTKVYFIVLHWN